MRQKRSSGFTLPEVNIALFIVGIGLLALAPLFIQGARVTSTSIDMSIAAAAAVERLELLRATGFNSLVAGGSVTSNVTGFFDTSNPNVTVRWSIVDNASPATLKTIAVRATATGSALGLPKRADLVTVRSR